MVTACLAKVLEVCELDVDPAVENVGKDSN
jgi:hypothetical protein